MTRQAPTEGGGGGAYPAWREAMTTNYVWHQLVGTDLLSAMTGYASPGGTGKNGVTAYCGAVVRHADSIFMTVANGGHGDYAGNEVIEIDLSQDVPVAEVTRTPSIEADVNYGLPYTDDDKPSSRHTYWNNQYDQIEDKVWLLGSPAMYGSGNESEDHVDSWDWTTKQYSGAGTYSDLGSAFNTPSSPVCADSDSNVWLLNDSSGTLYKWTRATRSVASVASWSVADTYTPMLYDPVRNRLVLFRPGSNGRVWNIGSSSSGNVTWGGAQSAKVDTYTSVIYDEVNDKYLLMPWNENNNVYQIDPSTFACTSLSLSGDAPPAARADGHDYLYGRFFYLPELGVVGVCRYAGDDLHVFAVGDPA
jgi:hypothetical protein